MVLLIPILLLISGCSKVSYVWDQGVGQLAIQNRAKDNQKVLSSPLVEKAHKEKIRKIEKDKIFFYKYFNEKHRNIYSKTTFLDNDAVTYLVISSPKNEIKPIQHCFPIVGCFPYLGLFSLEKAKEFEQEQKEENLATYLRPVYAYSTLGYFEDPILSSFFIFDKYSLTQLVFHELYHAIFFIDDEVDLNENLANFMSRKLMDVYYKNDEKFIKYKQNNLLQKDLRKVINEQVLQLKKKYTQSSNAEEVLQKFLKNDFLINVESFCLEKKISNCWPLKKKWNNASFSEFLTYEKHENFLDRLFKQHNEDVKTFHDSIKLLYKKYEDESIDGRFTDYLKEQINETHHITRSN